MDTSDPFSLAESNLSELEITRYPGRGIIAGLDESGEYLTQLYWIMGRSENSRNRILSQDKDERRVYTEAADPTKVKDPSLIIYNAMREVRGCYIVSNGDQTDTAADMIEVSAVSALSLQALMAERIYEPDAPNFTQRITAVSWPRWGDGRPCIEMSILRKSLFSDGCDRMTYHYDTFEPGLGFCITTYEDDDKPLPAFRGDPLIMPLKGDIKEIASMYWDVLYPDNKVALAVKFIGLKDKTSAVHIINKYKKV